MAQLLSCGVLPGVLVVCAFVLTGEIYYRKTDERGFLKTWHRANKPAAVFILLLNVLAIGRIVVMVNQ